MSRRIALLLLALLFVATAPASGGPVSIKTYLDIRGQSGPSVSPDGTRIAFLWSATGVNQPWTMPIAGGFPQLLNDSGQRTMFVEWSPVTGGPVLFGHDRDGDERTQFFASRQDGSDVRALTPGQDSVTRAWGAISPNGRFGSFASNERDPKYFDVYIVDLRSGQRRLVFQGDGSNYPAAWSPSSDKLVVRTVYDNFNNDLTVVDLRSGKQTLLTKHDGDAVFESVAVARDNTGIYCATDEGREFRGRAYISFFYHGARALGDGRYDVEELALSHDGRTMAYIVNRDGGSRLLLAPVDDPLRSTAVALPLGVIGSPQFDRQDRALVFTFSGALMPSAIWRYDLASKTLRQITTPSFGGVSPASFVAPRLVTFRSFDGRTIPAWYYVPAGAHAKSPVIVDVHGGPEAQAQPGFNAIAQYFVARGFAVLQPNVRGSSGYGRTYLHLADVRKRLDSVRDLHAAHDWLVGVGGADPAHIALYGGSYGGYMVLAGLTEYPDDWAAGVDVVGIANWVTFLENTSPYRRKNREATYGSLEHDRNFLVGISPINHVDRIKAPLLIFMGRNDPRVPAEEGQQMADALRARHVPVELTIFPDEGHGIVKYANRISAYTKIADFLDEHLGR